MSTSEAEPSLTADERYEQSLTYGLIIGTAILSMIVCSLRVSSHLEGSSTPEIRTSTTHELMSPAALHKGHHHKEVRIG